MARGLLAALSGQDDEGPDPYAFAVAASEAMLSTIETPRMLARMIERLEAVLRIR